MLTHNIGDILYDGCDFGVVVDIDQCDGLVLYKVKWNSRKNKWLMCKTAEVSYFKKHFEARMNLGALPDLDTIQDR